jgi:ABC-type branched-subunit amino acid transport system ATPase component
MHLSVAENLLAATPPRGRDKLWRTYLRSRTVRAAEAESALVVAGVLERFGLIDMRDQPAGVLSGGQGRLLEFARILVSGATAALLDEPLAGVNPVMAGSFSAAGSRCCWSSTTWRPSRSCATPSTG